MCFDKSVCWCVCCLSMLLEQECIFTSRYARLASQRSPLMIIGSCAICDTWGVSAVQWDSESIGQVVSDGRGDQTERSWSVKQSVNAEWSINGGEETLEYCLNSGTIAEEVSLNETWKDLRCRQAFKLLRGTSVSDFLRLLYILTI